MKRILFSLSMVVLVLAMLSSCRPPELEGAFVDYNAGRYDNALKLAIDASEKYPNNPEAWRLLGDLYGKKDMYKEMVQAYDKSLAIGPTFEVDIKNSKNFYFQSVFNKAVSNYNTFTKIEDRESEKATTALKTAIANFKNANLIKENYKAIDLIGLSFNLMGKSDSALYYYTQLTKIKPDTADAWIAVGNVHFSNLDYKKAASSLNKALEFEPNNVEAITLISQAYDLSGDRENAIKSYKKAKVVNPEEKAFPFNLGLLYIKMAGEDGVEEAAKKEYLGNSIVNFAEVIALDAEMKEPYELKSTAEIQLADYDAALATLKAAIEYHPEIGALWFNLGVVESHLGHKKEAEDAFAKAEELGYE